MRASFAKCYKETHLKYAPNSFLGNRQDSGGELAVDRFGARESEQQLFTFGGDHPEDLLDTPFEAYAASLADKAIGR
jgi:hypothetical protein